MHHTLKLYPRFFDAKLDGRKPWELRLNDRDFMEGETVTFLEYDPDRNLFTGRAYGPCTITYLLDLEDGKVVFTHNEPRAVVAAHDLLDAIEARVSAEGTLLEGISTEGIVVAVAKLAAALGRKDPHEGDPRG